MVRVGWEPALADSFSLMKNFQNAPETGEGCYAQYGAPEKAWGKASPDAETDAGN